MYVNYCFDKSIKPKVAELTDMMLDAYRKMIMEEDWISDETKAGAIEKIDNFKLNICYPDKVYDAKCTPINGEEGARHVQKEAVADLGALKCLLSIAKEQENFDYDMFFKQVAIIQKEARYEEAEKEYVATEEHPVEAYRANVPLQNYDDFLNFYDIKEGDGMYLAPEDRITVW